MEALYAKLYNKYTKLKVCSIKRTISYALLLHAERWTSETELFLFLMQKEKESQFYNQNHDQEVKFLNFVAGIM